jgi:two-component system response regulator FixJ
VTDDRTIHIVDDDAAVRRSLERLLDAAGFQTASYESGVAFLNAPQKLAGGCILLDIRMPGIDGLELQSRLAGMDLLLPVIVMTAQADVQSAVRAMKTGAVDFIEKPFAEETLFKAIDVALAKSKRDDRGEETAEAARRISMLSPREREVLDALVAGHPNKVIAFNLGISVRTVEVHRARMMDRLAVRQLGEAVRLAVLARLEPIRCTGRGFDDARGA